MANDKALQNWSAFVFLLKLLALSLHKKNELQIIK